MCKSMVFSGWDDSFERFYQAVRRAYRYGQTDSVRVHIPYIQQLESVMWENIVRKKENFSKDADEMEKAYINVLKGDLGNV